MDADARFWGKVSKGPGTNGHWIWIGAVADDGYGRFTLNANKRTKAVRPHRYAYALAHQLELDEFGILMHSCDVPICCRATLTAGTHIMEGSSRENNLDRLHKGRDTNGSGFRWRGLARANFAAASRALRDEIRDHGWSRPLIVNALLAGNDPEAPTLF